MRETYPRNVWAGFDWAQAELFFLALFSQDGQLKEALESSDVHSYTASLIFQTPIEMIQKKQRDLAKTVSFSLIYSGFDKGVAKGAIQKEYPNMPEDEISEAIGKYLESFFVLNNWVRVAILEWFDNDGWVTYFMGAKKRVIIPSYYERDVDKLLSTHAGRSAINAYGQNSVGLLLKSVFSGIKNNNFLRNNLSQFIPIFDSLNYVVPINSLYTSVRMVEDLATPVLRHNGFEIRMRTDWKISDTSWGEMKTVKKSFIKTEIPSFMYAW